MERLTGDELQRQLVAELPAVRARLQEVINNPRKTPRMRRRAARLERLAGKFLAAHEREQTPSE